MPLYWSPEAILICGPGESGKTTVSKMLRLCGFQYEMSTSEAASMIVFEASLKAGLGFQNAEECWAKRREYREFWGDTIAEFNGPDRLGLYRWMKQNNNYIIDGIRKKPELEACCKEFDALAIWVHRPNVPVDRSLDYDESCCHMTLNNTQSLLQLSRTINLLAGGIDSAMRRGQVCWHSS